MTTVRVYKIEDNREVNKLSSDNRKTYIHIIKYYMVNTHMHLRVISAPRTHTRASTWQSHVASTWAHASHPRGPMLEIPHFCALFNCFK